MSFISIYTGRKIKSLRVAKGYTQEQFGDMISLTRASIINIESGRHSPTIDKLYVICAILSCTPNDLIPPIKKANIKKKLVSKKRIVVKTKYKFLPVKITK